MRSASQAEKSGTLDTEIRGRIAQAEEYPIESIIFAVGVTTKVLPGTIALSAGSESQINAEIHF